MFAYRGGPIQEYATSAEPEFVSISACLLIESGRFKRVRFGNSDCMLPCCRGCTVYILCHSCSLLDARYTPPRSVHYRCSVGGRQPKLKGRTEETSHIAGGAPLRGSSS